MRIAVLFHARDRDTSHYVVDSLARCWREDGHEVTFLFGPRAYTPADILLVHVNLSVVPEDYLALAARYPVALNGRLRDIRKSVVSDNLVRKGDAWKGPVIVKSDLNYGGGPERNLNPLNVRSLWDRVVARISGQDQFRDWRQYRVYDRLADAPSSLLTRRDIVVERFLPERENGLYHLRMFQVLGNRWTCTRIASPQPVFKAGTSVSKQSIEPTPEVEQWRKRFNLDYGKIDYLIHEGRPVLIDVNKTTGAAYAANDPQVKKQRRWLAEGLYSCVT